ncbi:hypothetical protein AB0L06_08165 [Spirillospora sp. NPDC052269]
MPAAALAPPAGVRPAALYAGLVLSVLATLVPVVDVTTADTLRDHVRDAYPGWSASLVGKDHDAIVIYATVVGGLGVLCWLWTIWAALARRRHARALITTLFAVGTGVVLMNFSFSGGAYDRVLPDLYGYAGLLPAIAGVAAVVSAWRPRA